MKLNVKSTKRKQTKKSGPEFLLSFLSLSSFSLSTQVNKTFHNSESDISEEEKHFNSKLKRLLIF